MEIPTGMSGRSSSPPATTTAPCIMAGMTASGEVGSAGTAVASPRGLGRMGGLPLVDGPAVAPLSPDLTSPEACPSRSASLLCVKRQAEPLAGAASCSAGGLAVLPAWQYNTTMVPVHVLYGVSQVRVSGGRCAVLIWQVWRGASHHANA